ncbi:MAG: DoxX family membrane protein [Chryseobacterium sp.]|nr:DoxX family membrane protein [Chryseobacterium sp.]MBP7500154.1 DoxX family membrane protein [Chryseobacterium sp.]
MKDFKTTYFFLRLPVALSIFGHGLVRLPKLQTFTEGMVKSMEKSAIPESLLTPFGYFIPIAEFVIGLILLIGYQTKYTIYAGLALMGLLVFGSASVENWTGIEAQLVHSIYLGGLLWYWEKYRPASTH